MVCVCVCVCVCVFGGCGDVVVLKCAQDYLFAFLIFYCIVFVYCIDFVVVRLVWMWSVHFTECSDSNGVSSNISFRCCCCCSICVCFNNFVVLCLVIVEGRRCWFVLC
jgi:hypothetical protein